MKTKGRRQSINIVDVTDPSLTPKKKTAAYLRRNINALNEPFNQAITEHDIDASQDMAREVKLRAKVAARAAAPNVQARVPIKKAGKFTKSK